MDKLNTPIYDMTINKFYKAHPLTGSGYNKITYNEWLDPRRVLVVEKIPPYNDVNVVFDGLVFMRFFKQFVKDVKLINPDYQILRSDIPRLSEGSFLG